MIRYVEGDATTPTERPAIIAHVVNHERRWGRGFVVAVSRRWPQPERAYRTWEGVALGAVQFVPVGDRLWVANMCAQWGVGRGADGAPPIRYEALRQCLGQVGGEARRRGAAIVGPRFGAGLAGGDWSVVEAILGEVCAGLPVTIYDLPGVGAVAGDTWPIVAATGHRPKDLAPAVQDWCRIKAQRAAVWLRDQRGCRVGISGLALGWDTWWGQAVLDAGMDLWAYVPFPEQPEVWPRHARDEWQQLVDRAAKVVTVGSLAGVPEVDRKRAAVRLLHQRNDRMLADCHGVLALLDAEAMKGGTLSAVRKARQLGLPGVHVDPRRRLVRIGLPDLRKVA